MKSLMQFWRVAADELAAGCRCSTDIERDKATLDARIKHEGLSLLTITLPKFCSDFERSLERGSVDPHLAFHSWKFRGGLPAFLGGFLDRVFDRRSGDLLDTPDPIAIRSIRQLTLMFGKMQLQCSEARTWAALDQFVKIDREVGERTDVYIDSQLQREFIRIGFTLFREIFAEVDKDVYHNRIVPGHGPGNTADRLTGNGKYNQVEWTQRLETVFPYGEYCLPSWRHYYRLDDVHFRSPDEERPSKVTTVVKTQKTPRIIALEPTGMQYIQQGLMHRFVDLIEGDKLLGKVIGFTDQTPNQEFAREGSLNGTVATLDLSEASDRVSLQHVVDLLHYFPFVREGVVCSRTTRAVVPAHFYHPEQVVELRKFASMGSALCFPFEAMVFTTVIAMAINEENVRVHGPEAAAKSRPDFRRVLDGVRVYGDDIIVPVRYAATVISYLELFGFKVNAGKSFWQGKFRESCGKEYYSGTDVSVVRVRRNFPVSRRNVEEIVSTVSLRNQFWLLGMYECCEYLDRIIEELLPQYPVVGPDSPVLGRLSFESNTIDSFDHKIQRPLVKGFVLEAKSPPSRAIEETALLKFFLKRGDEPFFDKDHLIRSGRPDAVYLKRRLVPVSDINGSNWTSLHSSIHESEARRRQDLFPRR